jgi:hypothetical protein
MRGGGSYPVASQYFLDAPGAGSADELVDREGLPQVRGTFLRHAFLKVGAAESFEGGCFLQGQADIAGYGKCPGMIFPGLQEGRIVCR